MSTITYLIVGDYDNYHIGSGGGYVHPQVFHEKEYAIGKAQEVIKRYELEETAVMEINTSNGKIKPVWEQDS
jgi:hypothetical protein